MPSTKPKANSFPDVEAGREAGNDTEHTTDNPDEFSSSSDRDLGSNRSGEEGLLTLSRDAKISDHDASSSSGSSSEATTEEKDDVDERADACSHDSGAEETESTPQPLRTVLQQLFSFNSDPPSDSKKKLGRTRRQPSLLDGNAAEEAFCLMKKPLSDCTAKEFKMNLEAFTACPVVGEQIGSSGLQSDDRATPLGHISEVDPEPQSYAEVLKCRPELRKIWENAMARELNGLQATKTFSPATKPSDRKAVGSKWLFKWKQNRFGEVVKAKARLVAKGFSQREGIDYFETFAPTPAPSSIRLVVAVSLENDLDLFHFDAEQAFVQSKLDTDIYMQMPRVFLR